MQLTHAGEIPGGKWLELPFEGRRGGPRFETQEALAFQEQVEE